VGDGDASGNFAGVIQNGSGAVGLAKIGAGTQILRGPNTYTNGTTVNGGKLVFGAPGSFPAGGAVTVNNNAILDVSAVSPLTLGASQPLTSSNGTLVVALQPAGNAVTTPTLNSLGGTNYITVTDIPSISTYPAQFTAIKYTTLNGALNFGLAGPLPISPGTPFAAYVSNNVANGSVDVVVTAGPASLIWLGYSSGAPNSSWDTSTPNWITLGGPPTVYSDGSFVNFMDVASNGVATLNQSVSPAGMTVSNNSLTITFNGGGAIGGTGGLAKRGPGTLILDNAGANTFSGPIAINAGTLQIGNNDSSGSLPAFTPVNNNGALIFARNDVITISNAISGNGTLLQNGSGSVTLSAANTFSGAATVVQGTLILDNNSALGATNAGTTVATGATLDVGSPTLPQDAVSVFEPIFVAGAGVGGLGAIVNNSATRQLNALKFVTLTNNTVFGGSGRWDIRATGGTTGNPTGARLSTGNQPYSLVKTGANTVIIVSATVDPALADIDVRQGQFQIEGNTTSLGNQNNNLIVQLGATLSFFNVTNLMNKNFLLNGDGVATTVLNDSGNNTVIGPMTLNGSCIFDSDAGTSLVLNNTITGAGSLTKVDTGSLTFSGNSPSFAGSLRVNGGAVTLSGSLNNAGGVYVAGGKFVLNGTLLGTGGVTNDPGSTLAGGGSTPALVSALGQVSPGDTNGVVGTLTVGTLQLEGGASLDFDLNSLNTVGSGTNDLIVVNGNLTVNGNSITINPLGPLQKGPTHPYRLFNYTGSLIWNGDLSVSGPNNYAFAVDTNTPGQINVIASGGPPVWDGGSATVNNWSDAANWGGIAINPGNTLYFAGNNRLNNTNDTAANTSYTDLAFSFDSGQFILNGNPVYLTGNVANNSTNAERVAIGISYGDNRTFTGNSGPLVIGGGVTNTVSLTTLTLAGNGILTNIVGTATGAETNSVLLTSSNANWTLVDNASSATMTVPWVLNVNNGTFNFGVGASAPRLTSTSVNGQPQDHIVGATPNSVAIFNMSNGVFTTSARLNTGTAGGATGIVNQVGGTMNIGSQLQGANGAATAVSFVNVSGGTMNIIDTQLRTLFVASRGPGVLNVSGSGVINCGALDVSRSINSGIPGTVNLDGGTLSVSRVGTATANSGATTTGSTATFNFNGGTLKANASSATWFQGNLASPAVPITANVKAGGAVIDTDTNAITVLEPLRHDSALGGTPDGGLSKLGSGTLTLPIVSTYTGPTVVNAGTLLLSGSLPTSAVTVNGGVLSGNGICGSTLTVNAGGTVSPGTSAGILTVTNAVTLGGLAHMEVHPALGTNDLLRSITGNISYGGTLRVTNLGGVFLNGSSFKLFNAGGGSYLNGFTTFQLPGLSAGQSWNTSQLTVNGTLSVVGNPAPPSITTVVPSGGNLLISGGNGVTNGNFQVFSSTNVAAALSTWTLVGAGQFDSNGNFSFLMPIEVGTAQRFFVLRLQ
jgi:autotransporter-associated beta strand protein